MSVPNNEPTHERAVLYAEYKTVCSGNPVALMVLDLHSLDESGHCAECLSAIDVPTGGVTRLSAPALWPCATAYAVRATVLGWASRQVRSVQGQCYRQVNTEQGTPIESWPFAPNAEMLARLEAWVTSGIPAHRAVLYATADITLDEALTHETSGRTDEDLDRSLTTLVALL